ncbi:MAG: peptidoglycan DD-metalloendopeptidase family protein [Bacteroidetes bacterium]|nr:peptidoglycan DD-metalloendopeptidase family protein [Bacteroidota bacterium]
MKKYLPFLLPVIVFFFTAGCESQSGETLSFKSRFAAPELKRMSQEQYGIDVKQKNVLQANFEKNQFLTDVLQQHNVEIEVIEDIARKSEDVFDVRRMKAGNSFTIIKDEEEKVDYFIYEKTPADYVVFDLRDSVQIYEGRKKVVVHKRSVSGVIHSSLFETIQENGIDIKLARQLEEVYAWSVDFFDLKKGDYFKVICDEEFVDGESIGISGILAAQFHHQDRDYFAIHFEKDDTTSVFYDEEGRSLMTAFLKSPVKYSKISSRYSIQPGQISSRQSESNEDIDYMAPTGTEVYAVGDGIITKADYRKDFGNYVKIKHGIYASQYMHLAEINDEITVGLDVRQGQVIGYIGKTELAKNPSVRFRFWENGKIINPVRVNVPPAEMIPDEDKSDFFSIKEEMMKELETIKMMDTNAMFVSNY